MKKALNWISKHKKRSALLAGAAVVGIFLVLVALSYLTDPTRGYTLPATSAAAKKELTQKVDASITADALNENPNDYKGKVVKLSGQVFNTDRGGESVGWQIWTKPEQSEGNVLIAYGAKSEIKNEDYIEVIGVVRGKETLSNYFNTELTIPVVVAGIVNKVDRSQAAAPAKDTVKVGQTKDQSGVRITLERVEFADGETRLVFSLNNTSSFTASLSSYDAKLVQEGSQVEQKSVYEGKQFPDSLAPKSHTTGVIYFEKADTSKSSLITLTGSIEDENYSDITFTFKVSP